MLSLIHCILVTRNITTGDGTQMLAFKAMTTQEIVHNTGDHVAHSQLNSCHFAKASAAPMVFKMT